LARLSAIGDVDERDGCRFEQGYVHFENGFFVFFVCLCLHLLGKLQNGLEMGIVFLLVVRYEGYEEIAVVEWNYDINWFRRFCHVLMFYVGWKTMRDER
jgi:hypothetical protein